MFPALQSRHGTRRQPGARKLKAMLAIAVTAVGVSAFATNAHAVTISDNNVIVTPNNLDASFAGAIEWKFSNGEITPILTGTLTMNKERCFRVRLSSYDDGGALLHDTHGDKRCVNDASKPREQAIDFGDVADPLTHQAVVRIEEQNLNNDDWTVVNPDQTTNQSTLRVGFDLVALSGSGIDLGGSGFDTATGYLTTGSYAQVTWSLDDGLASASYAGYLHLNGFGGMCGRVELRYLDEAGTVVETVDGAGSNCAADDAHYPYYETLAGAASSQITQVQVVMQSSPNVKHKNWTDVGTPKTVSIADQA
jgi:hypothetical protein